MVSIVIMTDLYHLPSTEEGHFCASFPNNRGDFKVVILSLMIPLCKGDVWLLNRCSLSPPPTPFTVFLCFSQIPRHMPSWQWPSPCPAIHYYNVFAVDVNASTTTVDGNLVVWCETRPNTIDEFH